MSETDEQSRPTNSSSQDPGWRREEFPGLIWIPKHPLAWLAALGVGAVLVGYNTKCHLFLGAGSISRLQFSHGWPVAYQSGYVPGPGRRRGSGAAAPNFISGHLESNRDKQLTQGLIARGLGEVPTTPWGLREYARMNLLGFAVDILVAVFLLASTLLAMEHLLRVELARLGVPKRAVWLVVIGIMLASLMLSIISATARAIVMFATVMAALVAVLYCLIVDHVARGAQRSGDQLSAGLPLP